MQLFSITEKHGQPTSSASPKTRRLRSEINTSRATFLSACIVIFSFATVVNGFNSATISLPTSGRQVHAGFHVHTEPKRYRQRLPSDTKFSVSTSLKSAEMSESPVIGESASSISKSGKNSQGISKLTAMLSKIGMMAYLASMCLSLPIALLPPYLLHRFGFISKVKQQSMALANAQFCARWLLKLIPFCNLTCYSSPEKETDPQPSVWVCNHTSALDVFMILASDYKMRGKKRRPIKIVYVSLESNLSNMNYVMIGLA